MERPKQTVVITAGGVKHHFDAVIKAEHKATLKIADDPADAKGDKFTNNAAIEPRELTMEVMMSDTITTSDAMAKAHSSRSVSAFGILEKWRKERTLLSVKTRFCTYTDMLLQAIVVTEDDSNPEAMTAGITFREVIEKASAAAAKSGGGGRSKSKSKTKATDQGDAFKKLLPWVVGVVTVYSMFKLKK